jgi:succinyl-CoA synthetase beta subunit
MGLEAFQARKLAFELGLKPQQVNQAVQFMSGLYRAFEETDSSLMEINPFITCTDGRLFALDAKMNFDDNALFRHPELKELRDITEEDPLEVEASKYRDWQWPPWTLLSMRAGCRPTFSTSGAARTPNR